MYPELRFKGFTNNWKQKKLTDITNIYNGLTYHPKDKQKYGTWVLRSSNIQNGEIVHNDDVIVNNSIVNSPNVKPEDIIIVVRNGSKRLIGKHALVTSLMPRTVIGAFMNGFRCKNSYFLEALLGSNEFKKDVHESLGATINQLTKSDFKLMHFIIPPSSSEQQLIGKFFAKLDKLIQLQQKKVSLLKKLKRGYLQKLFPRKGELTPRLRFKGFHDKWMRKSLKDIVTYINTGKSKRKGLCKVCNSTYKYPFISASTLKGYSKTYDYKGVILLCTRVGNVGYLHLVNGKFQISDNTIVIKGKNNLYFIKGLLRTQGFQRIAEGSSQKLIREKELEQFLLLVPRFKEQEKINEFFKILNIQIKYQLCKLSHLRKLKKAYLQKMFC